MKALIAIALMLLGGVVPVASQEVTDPLAPAIEALSKGDLQTAEAGFGEALKRDPKNPRAWLGMSAFQAARGQITEALKSARRADVLEPDQPITLLTIARLQATLGSRNAALETLDRILVIDQTNVDAWLLSTLLLRDTGRPADGIELLERAADLGVDDPRLIEERALLLLGQDRSAEALELARVLIEEAPGGGRGHLIAGLALARQPGERTAAIEQMEAGLAADPQAPDTVRLELANLLVAEGRNGEALEHLAVVEANRPGDPEVHYRKGLALRAAGDAEGSKAALDTFQALKRQELEGEATAKRLGTRFNEAKQLVAENRLPEALEAVDAILSARPDHARSLAMRGKVLFSMGLVEEALTSMTQARSLEPGSVEFAHLEGLFLLSLGRADEAETALLRAAAIDGSQSKTFELLGQAASRQNQYEKAAIYFERALELGLDSAELRLSYANALESLGRTEEFEQQMAAYRSLRNP